MNSGSRNLAPGYNAAEMPVIQYKLPTTAAENIESLTMTFVKVIEESAGRQAKYNVVRPSTRPKDIVCPL